jgi:hypothetical protein
VSQLVVGQSGDSPTYKSPPRGERITNWERGLQYRREDSSKIMRIRDDKIDTLEGGLCLAFWQSFEGDSYLVTAADFFESGEGGVPYSSPSVY